MTDLAHILAASGDSDTIGKILGVAIVIVIGLVNVIASAIKKQQEQKHRDQVRAQIERGSSPPATVLPLPSTPRPRKTRTMPVPVPPGRRVIAKRSPTAAAIRPLVATNVKGKVQRTVAQPQAVQIVQPARPAARATAPAARQSASPAIDARALSRWLTPQTLRQQFILTEVLQPPIALRDSHLGC